MKTCIVRQGILTANKDVFGYEVLYPDDVSSLYNQADTEAANAIEDFLSGFDSEKFLEGKNTFLTFTPNLLLKNIPKIFSADKLVIQIEDNSVVHPLAQKIIYRYKKQGYRIAVKDFTCSARYFSLLDVVDYIKIDFSRPQDSSLKNIVSIANSFQKQVIAYNISNMETYEAAKQLGCKYMQGSYVAQAVSSSVTRMDHMQGNFFQLVVAITKEEPDLDEITSIISRDVTLAFSLIKLVNSAYFALRNQVRSVKQALVVLGLGQLKQWVYLLSFKRDDGHLPDALIKVSFLRANFCANLTEIIPNMPISKAEAYLLGMFSTLGSLMEVPLEVALEELAVSDDIKRALMTQEGMCGQMYKMVLCYESADWAGMTAIANQFSIPANTISQIYFDCVEYVNEIWRNLMAPYGDGEEPSVENLLDENE